MEIIIITDIEVNLDDKDAAWQFVVEKYGNRGRQ